MSQKSPIKQFYQRAREIEATIPGDSAVVVSRETADGGRAGTLTEAPKEVAARMIAQGVADLASPEQAEEFQQKIRRLRDEEIARRSAAQVRVSVITQDQADAMSRAASFPAPKGRKE